MDFDSDKLRQEIAELSLEQRVERLERHDLSRLRRQHEITERQDKHEDEDAKQHDKADKTATVVNWGVGIMLCATVLVPVIITLIVIALGK